MSKIICNQCNLPKNGIQTGFCNHCGKFGKTNRELSLQWWRDLDSPSQLKYWRGYQGITFTPSHSPEQLTGREIQVIWKKLKNPIMELPDEFINIDFDGIEEEHKILLK